MSDGIELRQLLSEAIAKADPSLLGRLESDADAYLDLLVLTARADAETTRLLHEAAISARTGGQSWDAIGRSLGMTRQAAQQRFGRGHEAEPAQDETRTLSPLTAHNEIEVLNRAGRYGWHSVGFGPLYHVVALSDEQWEHARVFVVGPARHRLEADGWERIGAVWFPWVYYGRPTGQPAEVASADQDFEVVSGEESP